MAQYIHETEFFLQEISDMRKEDPEVYVPRKYLEKSKQHLTQIVRHSTRFLIRKNGYFEALPPQLRSRLVQKLLWSEMHDFKYFFEDFSTGERAPMHFIEEILSELDT